MIKMTFRRLVFFTVLCGMPPGQVLAGNAFEVQGASTLHTAFESALGLNPATASAKDRVDAFKSRREAADALSPQALSLEGSYRTDQLNNNQGLRELALGVSVPVWNINEKSRTLELRDIEIERAELELRKNRLEVAGQVRQLFWNLKAAQADFDAVRLRLDAASQLTESVQKRVTAGEAAQTDLMQVRVLQAQVESELLQVNAALARAELDYMQVTGLSADAESDFVAETQPVSVDLSGNAHPELQLARVQHRLGQSAGRLVATQSRPNAEVGFAVVSERPAMTGGQDRSLLLTSRIPLGRSAEYQSRVLDARAVETEAMIGLGNTERLVAGRIVAARKDLELFSRLQIAATDQANLSEKVYRLHQRAYQLGEIDLATLLRLEQSAMQAQRLSSKASIEYAAKVSAYLQALGLTP